MVDSVAIVFFSGLMDVKSGLLAVDPAGEFQKSYSGVYQKWKTDESKADDSSDPGLTNKITDFIIPESVGGYNK